LFSNLPRSHARRAGEKGKADCKTMYEHRSLSRFNLDPFSLQAYPDEELT
jgi:hypothetical protein